MSWKDALAGLEEFSRKAEDKASHIAQDRSRVAIEPVNDETQLAKYSPLVEEVYRYFAARTGSRFVAEKVGPSEIASIFEIAGPEGADDLRRANVFPVVHMFPPSGVLVEAPLRAETAVAACKKVVENWFRCEEGYYVYKHQDKEGGWINTKTYFIPFEFFTQLKLARKIAELYREAMKNYLKELHG